MVFATFWHGYFAFCMVFATFGHVRLPFYIVFATFWYFKRSCGCLESFFRVPFRVSFRVSCDAGNAMQGLKKKDLCTAYVLLRAYGIPRLWRGLWPGDHSQTKLVASNHRVLTNLSGAAWGW